MRAYWALVAASGFAALALTAPAAAQDAAKPDEPAAAAAATPAAEPSDVGHVSHEQQPAGTPSKAHATKDGTKNDTAAKPDQSSASATAKEETVCRSLKPTGSRVPKKVCATPATWAEVDARGKEGARQFMQQMGDQGAQARPPTGLATPF